MQKNDFKLIRTLDGSLSLHSDLMNESYHSLNGAITESLHVFINAGLKEIKKTNIKIFEVGFGTGLNCFLTLEESIKANKNIKYECIEAYLLDYKLVNELDYYKFLTHATYDQFISLHKAECEVITEIIPNQFCIKKINKKIQEYQFSENFDLVYFDAFAPTKQPEMWEENIFSKIYEKMNMEGILVTYCAMGEVRRRLQRCGFVTERISGPPGKREMLRARKV